MISKLPVAVFSAAANETCVLVPAATSNGLGGLELTPFGKPERVTWTGPVKPFSGLMDRFTAELVAPWWTLTEFEAKPIVKSGCGGGGGS